MDPDWLYAMTLGEEQVFWNGWADALTKLYYRVKARWPDLPVYQWWTPPVAIDVRATGGWEALAAQIFYPEVFGGTWGWCPDPVDFNYYQIVGIYEDDNAYTMGNEWHRIERPNARRLVP